MEKELKNNIPRWLEADPEHQDISLPVKTRTQSLPFGELTWENFERLCLRLIRKESNVIDCRMYGERGDKQEGIDIYVECRPNAGAEKEFHTYQCKREQSFGPSKIKSAVTKFIGGDWASKTKRFVLCTQESLKATNRENEVIEQRKQLARKKIDLEIYDCEALSMKLKSHPNIVGDFFGDPWEEAFCGRAEVTERHDKNTDELLDHYRNWLLEKTLSFRVPMTSMSLSITEDLVSRSLIHLSQRQKSIESEVIVELYQYSLLLGDSGSGKSTLLRRLAYQLASIGKTVMIVRLSEVTVSYKKSGNFQNSLIEVSTDGFKGDKTLLAKALSEPDFLLLDGLDECKEERELITEKLLDWSIGHANTKVVISSRPEYDVNLPPNWEKFELQPFSVEDARRLTSLVIKHLQMQGKHAVSNKQVLEDRTVLSLLSKSPLFIGFVGCLWVAGKLTIPLSRTDIYSKSTRLFYDYLPQGREASCDIGEAAAQRIFKLVGWMTSREVTLSLLELKESITNYLKEEGHSLYQAEQEVEKGITFWKDRQIFAQRGVGTEQRLDFIHPSLGEYAAGQYACKLSDSDFHVWLEDFLCDRDYAEVIDFACGLGAGDKILNYIFMNADKGTNRYSSATAIRIIGASPTVADKYIEIVVKQVAPQLDSPNPLIIGSAIDSLLSILPKGKTLIANIARNLENPKPFWNEVATTILLLECGEDVLAPTTIIKVVESILSRWPSEEELSSMGMFERISVKREGSGLGLQAISSACSYLIKRDIDVETVKKLMHYISSFDLEGSLRWQERLSQKIVESIQNPATKDRLEWLALFKKKNNSALTAFENHFNSEKLARQLKDYEETRNADRAFLDAIVRISRRKGLVVENKPFLRMVELGKVIRGMQWGRMLHRDWLILQTIQDLRALDTVIEGMLSILDISLVRCLNESLHASQDIERFFSYNLVDIKESLEKKEVQNCLLFLFDELYQDKSATDSLYRQTPDVPLPSPDWERAAELELSADDLLRALECPSLGIVWSAAFLIKHGAGGPEAIKMAQKNLDDEDWELLFSRSYEDIPY